MTINEPSMNGDASARALALLCELQSRIDTLAGGAADYPNRFALEPFWRLGDAVRHVRGGEM